MQMQIIALLFILFINITDSTSCKCKNDENNIYQLTTIIKYLQPFYPISPSLPNDMNNKINDQK